MDKTKKIVIIFIIVLIVIISASFGIYKYNNTQAYNKLIISANQYMKSGEYDKAIALFEQSLTYKENINVEKSISLARKIKELKSIYNEGIKLMDEKKYLEAIDGFKKITKEDEEMYKDAQNKIQECKIKYTDYNIEKAKELAEHNKFDEANKYLDEVLKIDKGIIEAKQLKDTYNNEIRENREKIEKQAKQAKQGITPEQACDIVKVSLKNNGNGKKYSYDHDDSKSGVAYYVIQAFDDMGDHVATSGWYYVEKRTGKAYEWDLAEDKLMPLK